MKRLLFLAVLLSGLPLHAATLTYGAASGNWSDATKWVGAATPTASDDVVINGTSGAAVTVDTSTCVCKTLTCTGYTGNIRFNSSQTLTSSGSVLFANTHTLTGTGTLAINATATLTSAGLTFPGSLTLIGTATGTLGDAWALTGTLSQNTGTFTLNGNSISVAGSLTTSTGGLIGTTVITMNGSGNLSTSNNSNSFGLPIVINTAGNVTIGTNMAVTQGCAVTYTAGTVVTTSSTLNVRGGTVTINAAAVTWNNFTQNGTTPTIVLGGNLNIGGNFGMNAAIQTTMSGAFDITCGTLFIPVGGILKIVSGRTLNVTTAMIFGGVSNASMQTFNGVPLLQSVTASSSAFLNYTGPLSGNRVYEAAFTDIDASGSTRGIINYNGSTLTRTSNIFNITLPTTMGYVY